MATKTKTKTKETKKARARSAPRLVRKIERRCESDFRIDCGRLLDCATWREVVPVICARKGSSVKDKNVREYNGKPLLQSAIERALDAFGLCFVSTDSEEYAEKARSWGAFVPFIEQEICSRDMVSAQLFNFVEKTKLACHVDFNRILIAQMQCTSPNTSVETLTETVRVAASNIPALDNYMRVAFVAASAYELTNKANAIFTEKFDAVRTFSQRIDCSPIDTPRQKLPKLYGLTGGLFVVPARQIFQLGINGLSVFAGGATTNTRFFFHVADEREALDIDRAADFLKK